MRKIMAKFAVNRLFLLAAVLMGAALATAQLGPAAAQVRVGVASGTSGDPMGKPPGGTDRILRVGTDVQANEVITTRENDRAQLLFLDGTAVTVGPNAQLMIDKFVYDPATQKGELAINATKGVLRVIGGKISKNNAITVSTPSATMGIRGGIMVIGVGTGGAVTTAIFIFGNQMTVTAAGQTQTVTIPNQQVVTNQGSPPGTPTAIPPGSLGGVMGQLVASSQGANAAVVQAITTAIAANLNNAAVLASLVTLAQSVLAAQTITTTTVGTTTVALIPINPIVGAENNTQNFASPN